MTPSPLPAAPKPPFWKNWWFWWIVVLALIVLGSFTPDKSSSGSSHSATPSSGWGSSQEHRLVGIYQCATPAWVLQLKWGGNYAMETLDTGDKFSGTWSVSGDSGVLSGTYPSKADMSISIQSDGAIVIDKYGYTFVRTQ